MSRSIQQQGCKPSPSSDTSLAMESLESKVSNATTANTSNWAQERPRGVLFLMAAVLTIIPFTPFLIKQRTQVTFIQIGPKVQTLQERQPIDATKVQALVKEQQPQQSCRSQSHPRPPACPYGSLPGKLNMSQPTGEKWQTLTRDCLLKNYVGRYLTPNSSVQPLSLLFLSDSMDSKTMHAFCTATGGSFHAPDHHFTFNSCFGQKGWDELKMHQIFLPTLTPTEHVILSPSDMGSHPYMLGYKHRMNMARGNWSKLYPGKEPDMVVMGGGLWDNLRWLATPLEHLQPIEQPVRVTKTIPSDLLSWWVESVEEAVCYAKHLFPNSKVVWRTFAMASYNWATGATDNQWLGTKEMLAQIRAAGMAAAFNLGVEVVHVEPLVESVPDPRMYLADLHHPKDEYMLEILNIILNIALREDDK